MEQSAFGFFVFPVVVAAFSLLGIVFVLGDVAKQITRVADMLEKKQ